MASRSKATGETYRLGTSAGVRFHRNADPEYKSLVKDGRHRLDSSTDWLSGGWSSEWAARRPCGGEIDVVVTECCAVDDSHLKRQRWRGLLFADGVVHSPSGLGIVWRIKKDLTRILPCEGILGIRAKHCV